MIDTEKAKLEFDNYAKQYDIEDETLNRKYYHIYRVMKIAGEIAESLKLSEEEIQIAKIVGLLHDIARFEQYKRYKTFSDVKSIDHGDFGAEILKKDNFIRKFVETDEYDEIIIKSVKNHNKFKIEENLSDKELLYSKIARDADKLDIFFEILTMFYKDLKEIEILENGTISEEIMEQVINEKQVLIKRGINNVDKFIIILCFTFDLNFKYSFDIMQKEDYINKIINRFDFKNAETKERIEQTRQILNNYIQKNRG